MGRGFHIGVLTTSYPRGPDDPAGNFVAGLNRYLRRRGCEVTVVAAGEGRGGWERGAAGEGVLRLGSPLFYGGGAPERLFGPRAAGWALEAARFSAAQLFAARALAGCGALVSHFVVPSGVVGALVSRGRPHLAIAHSSDVHLLRRLGFTGILRALGRAADLVYSDASLRVSGAPGRVVPMGIDAAAFAPPAGARAAARARLGLSGPTALFLGRLVPVKGLHVLLAALRSVPELVLLVAGDGPERAALAWEAAPLGRRVRLLGEVRGAARAELLWAADLLVLPSLRLPDGRTEGAPTVLREALCAGCPVVASAVGGAAALVGEAGLLVPPGEPGALAAALRAALDGTWQARARVAARVQAQESDWARVAPRLLGPIAQRLPPLRGAIVAAPSHPG